jgi:two-component system cell cycle sensor histidine kinase/response regulator CckA
VRMQGGEILGVGVLVSDVTARKAGEQALRNSEERYRDLVENAHDIIFSIDLEGRITSINKAGEQSTGYSREEAVTLNLLQTIVPEDLDKANDMIRRKVTGDNVTAYEMEIMAKNGRRIAVEANTKLILHNGVPVGIQGIARDVTKRKQLEEQLRQSQKMEAIGQLAGGVAHDFNNLLTAINGYSNLALQRMAPDDRIKSYLEEIRKAGDRAANLTRQLLAFGRKQMLKPLALNLNDIVADMNKMLRRLIGEDIRFTAKLDPSLKKIKADPGQVEQVLVNLVVNSRDAMPKGGCLTIETMNFNVDHEDTSKHIGVPCGRYVLLAVSDTGCGMSIETKARIFEPFFTTKEKGKGTGLGLSTVYGIIKQSGGNIWVYSEPDKGTTVKVYLPQLQTAEEPIATEVLETTAVGGSETILLVEDEEVVRGLARQILEQAGYNVLDASGGEEAIRLCHERNEPIHLLLTDIVMPETSGKEIAQQLTSLRPATRVLFMSGYTDDAIVHHGVLDSNVEFIQKPFTPVALTRKVREVLDLKG